MSPSLWGRPTRKILLTAGAMITLTATATACGGGSGGRVPGGTCANALSNFSTAPYAVSTGNAIMLWNAAAAARQDVVMDGYKTSQLAGDLSKLEHAAQSGSTSSTVPDLKTVYSDCGETYGG